MNTICVSAKPGLIPACLTLGLLAAISGAQNSFAQSVYTLSTNTTSTAWANSNNWTGGVTNKMPGVDAYATSAIDGNAGDTAVFGSTSISSTPVAFGINFNNTTANTGVGNNSSANGSLTLGAIVISNTLNKNLNLGKSDSSTFNATLTLTGATVNSVSNVIIRNNDDNSLSINGFSGGSGTAPMRLALGNSSDNKIVIDGSGNVTINTSIISSAGSTPLTLQGGGTGNLTLSGNNTYSGGTIVSTGRLLVTNTAGSGTGTGNVAVSSGAALGGNGTIGGNVTLNSATIGTAGNTLTLSSNLTTTGTSNVAASSTVNVAGTTTVSSGTFTLNGTLGGSGSVVVSAGAALVGNATINNATSLSGGSLGTSGNTLALGSTLAASGNNTISTGVTVNVAGTTTISSGVFSVNGTLGGAGAKIVGNTATLGGAGTVIGTTTIENGGTLAPGNSPGLLTFTGDLTFNNVDAKAVFEVNGPVRATDYDAVNVSGVLTYNGDLTVSFGYSPSLPPSVTYNLFDFASKSGNFDSISIAGTYTASLSRTGDIWSGVDAGSTVSFSFDQTDGVLTITAIPEPSAYAAIAGMGMIGFALYRRRKHTSKLAA